jgi:hypothetical protein
MTRNRPFPCRIARHGQANNNSREWRKRKNEFFISWWTRKVSTNFDKENHVKKMLQEYMNHERAQELNATVSQCLGKVIDETQKEQKELVAYAKSRTAGISSLRRG